MLWLLVRFSLETVLVMLTRSNEESLPSEDDDDGASERVACSGSAVPVPG